ncbi:Auxin-induced protein 5NG4 [Hordeum vulgare]|nr:Auxin-induced protein 5NG4 [Hordeum vulgare]
MQFYDPTYRLTTTMLEMRYIVRVVVVNTLRVWGISRWRGPMKVANYFLIADYHHLPPGSLVMFCFEKVRADGLMIGLTARFTNHFDAYLLGKVFWCGCEFIAFTTHNIFTKFYNTFPTREEMHTLTYIFPEDEE